MGVIGRETVAGRSHGTSREVLALLGDRGEPLSEEVLNYAVRGPE